MKVAREEVIYKAEWLCVCVHDLLSSIITPLEKLLKILSIRGHQKSVNKQQRMQREKVLSAGGAGVSALGLYCWL